MNGKEKISRETEAVKFGPGRPTEKLSECVAVEDLCQIVLNGQVIATLACSPANLRELAAGYLISEGIVDEIDSVTQAKQTSDGYAVKVSAKQIIEQDALAKRIITSGCAGGKSVAAMAPGEAAGEPVLSMYVTVSREQLAQLVKEMAARSKVFRQTGGVHSAALCGPGKIIFQTDDIGRHNAVDKVIGWAKLNGVELQDKILLSTGRISAEIVLKAARAQISLVASRGAPTSRALAYAQQLGLTVAGFVRGKRMTVYTWCNRCSD